MIVESKIIDSRVIGPYIVDFSHLESFNLILDSRYFTLKSEHLYTV